MEEYKSSEGFAEEVTEALGEAFDSNFASCKSLVGKSFPSLDLSGITQEAGLTLASKMEAWLVLEVGSIKEEHQLVSKVLAILITPKVEPFALTEVPTATFVMIPPPSSVPIKVLALVEVILLENDVTATLAKAP
ncbi:hypothetical protein COCNU_06G018600 [Cocos nucifera]|uniref:Uncharacterized protein n=1 Tax=Cocos nucifera TaxID=13894 RepID=A0A8K0IEG5_COCNU|nr:hypothetical protein COCNU_06G018600 [Cocos nucifera]